MGLGARAFLAERIDGDEARRRARERLATRDQSLLYVLESFVYRHEGSPYLKLLRWAGIELGDLRAEVKEHGVEPTLERLRDAGVRVTFDELRGRTPIVRNGLELAAPAEAFDNPFLLGRPIGGRSSGSSGTARRVALDWVGQAEEAPGNYLMYEAHRLLNRPLGLWLAGPPGLAGLNALLVNSKRAHPPEAWFTPVARPLGGTHLPGRLSTRILPALARTTGLRLPRPEPVPVGEEETIARWLADRAPAILRTSASGAVRVAEACRRGGHDVAGCTALVAGEPLTTARRKAIEAAGFELVPHYGASEISLVAAGCARPTAGDDMHVCVDRLGVVTQPIETAPGHVVQSLLFTTLSRAPRLVLLNADIGDNARFERRDCGCLLGELGFDVHVSSVRSHAKLTGEGMGLVADELGDAVAACLEEVGGGPNDFQFWERPDEAGTRLVLVVSPDLRLDEEAFMEAVLEEIGRRAPGGSLVAETWRRAGTFELVRERPRATATLKLPTVITTPS